MAKSVGIVAPLVGGPHRALQTAARAAGGAVLSVFGLGLVRLYHRKPERRCRALALFRSYVNHVELFVACFAEAAVAIGAAAAVASFPHVLRH